MRTIGTQGALSANRAAAVIAVTVGGHPDVAMAIRVRRLLGVSSCQRDVAHRPQGYASSETCTESEVSMGLHTWTERIGTIEAFDGVAKPTAAAVKRMIGRGFVKDTLSGTQLGHPAHPLLTDVPIGAFTSAAILDVVGGASTDGAADLLVAAGIASAVPTAVSGAADWSETYGEDTRTGFVHALANVAALVLYGGSLIARRAGRRDLGRALGFAGFGLMSAGGYLGGHLSYSRGVGVNNTFFQHPPEDWTTALSFTELADGKPHRVEIGDATVLLVRQGDSVHAIGSRCSHAGGPLDEGAIDPAACTVTCPWHQSEFRLDSGAVVHGPASVPQPAYDARIIDGRVEVRLRPSS